MVNLIRNKIFCFMTILVMLGSCVKMQPRNTEELCIPPPQKIAYPVNVPVEGKNKRPELGPLGGWQLESSLPEFLNGNDIPEIVARSNEIWVLPLYGNKNKVFRYYTSTRQWKIYDTIDDFLAAPRYLLLTKRGELLGIDIKTDNAAVRNKLRLWSKYNENTDRFESIQDIDGILDKVLITMHPPTISEDANGILWFFGALPGDDHMALYSFNTSTLKAEEHLVLVQHLYAGPVISEDGTIWFYSGGSEKQLLRFHPATRQIQPYVGLPDFNKIGHIITLFFDQSRRLWLDNKGWLDFTNSNEPIWYEIIPSPVFLTDHGWFPALGDGLPSRYGWVTPYRISQSSNGWLWFTTSNGTIRLDLEKEEWCLFTTGSSPVAEDEDGNLWIVVFGKLYKYSLNP